MSVELTVLGYAALLQFAQFLIMAVPVNLTMGIGYTAGSRDNEKVISGIAGRLKRAFDNHFQGLLLFTIAVVVVTLGEAGSDFTVGCAWTYLVARVLYVPAYASGIFMLRSAIWFVAFAATALMIVAALF